MMRGCSAPKAGIVPATAWTLAVDLQVSGTVLWTWGLCLNPVPVSDLPALSSPPVT